jgi:hypothetical protein
MRVFRVTIREIVKKLRAERGEWRAVVGSKPTERRTLLRNEGMRILV